jgi:hypothetical protein
MFKKPALVVLFSIFVATANFSSALAAPATDIKWRETPLPPSSVISVNELANSNSSGKKTWAVKGDCSIDKAKTQITTMASGTCIVTLKIAKKASFKAITATKALSISGSGATNTSATTATGGSTTATTATTVTTVATTVASTSSPIYYTPAPFSVILKKSVPGKTLSALSAVANRSKFVLADASSGSLSSNFLTIDSSSAYSAPAASFTAQTYESYLKGMFSAVSDTTDTTQFRIDSVLHNIYSLDFDAANANKLVFKLNWGWTTGSPGFISFGYDQSTNLLQAKKRYVLNTSSYTHSLDGGFSAANYYVKLSGGVYSLVASAGEATKLYMFKSPIDYDMPLDFNPDSVGFVSNDRVSLATITRRNPITDLIGSDNKLRDVSATYKPQIAVAGSNSATKTAADTKLAEIKKLVEAQGGKLRYDTLAYQNFREGALGVTLQSNSIADGTLGQLTAPYVYFTNEKDSAGTYHPFMIIASFSISDKPNLLNDVRRPPGAGGGGGYGTSNVTRDATLQMAFTKIPMRDYGLVSSIAENTLPKSLWSEVGSVGAVTTYNYASTSTNGVAYDGVDIYPAMNNTMSQSQAAAEICSIGIHVGQGMGLHYHADGFSALSNGLSLYNADDYTGKTHPPLIGFGWDGIALFGKYIASSSSMLGYGVALDDFGGHDHDGIGYHYHAHTAPATSNLGKPYTLHLLLKGAWRGKINSVPNFWTEFKDSRTYFGG